MTNLEKIQNSIKVALDAGISAEEIIKITKKLQKEKSPEKQTVSKEEISFILNNFQRSN